MSLYLLTSPTGLIPPFVSVVANPVTNAHVHLLNWMVLSSVMSQVPFCVLTLAEK